MGKLKQRVFALCTAAVMIMSCGLSANAEESIEDLEAQAEALREQNEERQQAIDAIGDDLADNEYAIELINAQIDGYLDEIAAYRKLVEAKQESISRKKSEIERVEENIAGKERAIADKTDEIRVLEAENKENLDKFAKLARHLYMNDTSGQLPLLRGSDDWYDYFTYPDVIKNIGKQNMDFMKRLLNSIEKQEGLIAELNADISALEADKSALEAEKADYERQAEELERDKSELEQSVAEKHSELFRLTEENDELRSKISGLKNDIEEANRLADELDEQIKELIRQAQENRDPEAPDYSGDGLRWPLDPEHHTITDTFGYKEWRGSVHHGIDISDGGIHGEYIYAAQSGTVVVASVTCPHNEPKDDWNCGCGFGYGNYVLIDHGGSLSTLYGHCQAIYVSEGEYVEKGDIIGEVGSTGWSTWWHLHFETRENGTAVDPLNYVGGYIFDKQKVSLFR